MSGFSKELLEKTIDVWQPHSPYPLILEDAIEIAQNTAALFDLIIELEEKYGKAKTNIQYKSD